MDEDQARQPPSKAAKLLAVMAFFVVLFLIAASVGLPVPVGLVGVFFISAGVPIAFVVALIVAGLFRVFARMSRREDAWPFFDVALQTFIVGVMLATGIFILQFPTWVRSSYPGIRADVEKTIDTAVAPESKQAFLEALDRFWEWNVRFLLEEGEAPSTVAQQEMRNTVASFGQSLAPDCPDCEPKLTAQEVGKLTVDMNRLTQGDTRMGNPATAATGAPMPFTAATAAVTAPAATTQAATAVTSNAR